MIQNTDLGKILNLFLMPVRHTFQLLPSTDMERPGSFSWDGSESAALPVMSAEEMCRTAAERIHRAGGHRGGPELEQGEQSRGLGGPDLAWVGEKPFCGFLGPFLGSGPYILGEILSGCVAVGCAAWERASFSLLFCFSSLLASPSSLPNRFLAFWLNWSQGDSFACTALPCSPVVRGLSILG